MSYMEDDQSVRVLKGFRVGDGMWWVGGVFTLAECRRKLPPSGPL